MREITSARELDDFVQNSIPAVVDFAQREGCVPCKRLAPHFEAAAGSLDHVNFAVVYLDELGEGDFASIVGEFGLMGTPTLILFGRNFYKRLDARTAPLLIKEINSLL